MAQERDLKHRQARWSSRSLIPRNNSIEWEIKLTISYHMITKTAGKRMKMLFIEMNNEVQVASSATDAPVKKTRQNVFCLFNEAWWRRLNVRMFLNSSPFKPLESGDSSNTTKNSNGHSVFQNTIHVDKILTKAITGEYNLSDKQLFVM